MKKVLLALAISAASVSAHSGDFVISTGSEGGSYERLGNTIAKNIGKQSKKYDVDFDFEVINSNGSIENIERFSQGDAHAVIVQADALNVMPPSVPFKAKSAHTETVYWLYSKKKGVKDIKDIEGDKKQLIAMVDGSGAIVTMRSFVAEDDGYKPNLDNAILADDVYEAAELVADGDAVGMLYVGKKIPSEIAADFGGKIAVGEATDSDFNDAEDVNGEPLYFKCDVNSANIGGLQTSTWGDPDTVCLKAMVVYSTDYETKGELRAVKKGIVKSLRGIE